MPLPIILAVGAAIAGASGVGAGISGGVKMKKANDKVKEATERDKNNVARMERKQNEATSTMDRGGRKELEILKSFEKFQDLIERIQNRPDFKQIHRNNVTIPQYNPEDIKNAHVGAAVLLGGLGGAAVGTAGGFAAAGATTAAVMALGTASTGTAIASLSGAAATNATLAALGGGAVAAGGGGMALGTAVLGGATLGIGLLVGGIIFNFTGRKLSNKADKAWEQMQENEKEINKVVDYLNKLSSAANGFYSSLKSVERIYRSHLEKLEEIEKHKVNWNDFTPEEKLCVENLVLAVGVLYQMCKVQLVLKTSGKQLNQINYSEINKAKKNASEFVNSVND